MNAEQVPFLKAKMESVLDILGVDLSNENFKDTPMRWLKFLNEFMQPYDPAAHLSTSFEPQIQTTQEGSRYGQAMVVQSNIPYQAVCAHHLVPVLGRVS